MSKTILVVPDQHAHPDHDNLRADWLGELIVDLRPDIVVNGGDAADMASLSDYDRGKRAFVGRSYKKDIEAHLDFQERMWAPMRRAKRKTPYRIIYEGNHEHRIERALDASPELQGTIGFRDYDFSSYYHEVIRYDGSLPGISEVEGILFAHFFPTGISGRPVGGERPAHMLLAKNSTSCVTFHSHTLDYASRRTVKGEILSAVVAGCYQDYVNDWAGPVGKFWRSGVAVLRNVSQGEFDFQWISLDAIKKAYSNEE